MTAWMFPGQGSQRPEMAAGLAACSEMFSAAEPLVDADLERLCTVDPKPSWPAEVLQPALFITSCGAARAMQASGQSPQAVVGHSLGEYAALVAAGALEFEGALNVVSIRGRAMTAAARANPGGMAAVLGLDRAAIIEICDDNEGVWIANLNSPTQTVISGKDTPLANAADQALRAGAKRVVRLDVPMAGHSPLMAPAAEELAAALDATEVRAPSCVFYSVADASPHTEPAEIRQLLVSALTSPVRFTETVERMQKDGLDEFVEVGPGSVLGNLVKRTITGVSIGSVSSDEDAAKEPSKILAGV
ncbi:MAG: ACP S-malonyltransferase [Actinomycetota bacterium]